jgi:hypothetical protein
MLKIEKDEKNQSTGKDNENATAIMKWSVR